MLLGRGWGRKTIKNKLKTHFNEDVSLKTLLSEKVIIGGHNNKMELANNISKGELQRTPRAGDIVSKVGVRYF